MKRVADDRLERLAIKIILDNSSNLALFGEEFFSSPTTIILYRELKDAYEKGLKVDRHILISRLVNSESLDFVGGEAVVDDIYALEYDKDLVEEYSTQLKDYYLRRLVSKEMFSIANSAHKSSLAEMSEKFEALHREILQTAGISVEESDFSDLLEEEYQRIVARDEVDHENFIRTGYTEFDKLTGGFSKSSLVIIGGRPSIGKTALMLNVLLNMAKNGRRVSIIPYEMSKRQMTIRSISTESKIPSNRINQNLITEEERVKITSTIKHLQSLPIHLAYTAFASINELSNYIRLSHQSQGIEVYAIDYVQLIPVKPGNETQELARIARILKALAVELNVVIILLSQLNRGLESRKDKRPLLSDLRQSGGLEENADMVIFPYRKFLYNPTPANVGLAEIILAKNRNGPLGVFNVMFDDSTTTFYEL